MGVGASTGEVIGSDGFARIAFINDYPGTNNLTFARCTDADCLHPVMTVVDDSIGWLNAGSYILTLGPDGFARILYAKPDNSLWVYQCLDNDCVTTTSHQIVSGTNFPGQYGAEITMGPDGFPRVAYADADNGYANHFVRCLDASCSSVVDTIVGGTNAFGYAVISLTVGQDGFARIVYPRDNDTIEYVRCADADCTTPVITSVVSDPGHGPGYQGVVVRMGSDGYGRIAYLNSNGAVHYVACSNADCTAPSNVTVATDANGNTSNGIGLAIRSGNLASVAYGGTDKFLHLVNCTNATCSTSNNSIIDTAYSNGTEYATDGGISLVVDSNNLPRMFYSDYTDSGARYTRLGTLDGTPVVTGSAIGASNNRFGNVYTAGLSVLASGYVNWGNVEGSSGYGIRDNSGTIQFKNATGDWTNVGGAGTTAGSVFFGGTNGVLTEDNGNFFYDATNHRLGLGTTTPTDRLTIAGGALRIEPTLLAKGYLPLLSSQSNRTAVSGHYAYVANNTAGLKTIDISDPAHPTLVSTYKYIGFPYDTSGSSNISRVVISGTYAYILDVGSNRYQIKIIDISNPANPTLAGTYDNYMKVYTDMFISGQYIYATTGNDELDTFEISSPTQPSFISSVVTGTHGIDGMYVNQQITVSGKYAFVADGLSGFKIFDLSDPRNPLLVGTYETPGYMNGVTVVGRYAYVCNLSYGLKIIDISNPANPTLVSTYSNPLGFSAEKVAIAGQYAYLANFSGGLELINISDPANPTLVTRYNPSSFDLQDVSVIGRYVYLTELTRGLYILDTGGMDSNALFVGSTETGSLSVSGNAQVGQQLSVNGGLNIGPGGFMSQGSGAIFANGTNTALTVTQSGTGDILNLVDGATEVFSVLDGGNVGIGIAAPLGRLHAYIGNGVVTAASYDGYFENLATNTATDGINKYGLYVTSTGSFSGAAGTATNNYGLYVDTPTGADNNYAAIFAGGNVGIGTTSPSQLFTVYNGTTTGTYTTSGWTHSSDARLKTNIVTIDNALDTVMQLNGVSFNWKNTPESDPQIGLIAQDVLPVLPQVVTGSEENGYGIAYGNITALLVNAVKELDINMNSLVLPTVDTTGPAGEEPSAKTPAPSFMDRFFTSLRTWLADAANGIETVTAKVFKSDKVETKALETESVNTKELCVDGVCVTKEQFMKMVDEQGGATAPKSAPASTDPAPADASADGAAPSVETPVVPESTPAPAEEVSPTPADAVSTSSDTNTLVQ